MVKRSNSIDGNTELVCTVLRGNPMVYSFTWTFNNGTDSIDLNSNSSVLMLTNFTSEQFGTYSCMVSNVAGTGKGNATIMNNDEESKFKV